MDGMLNVGQDAPSMPASTLLGILYAEDFDDPTPNTVTNPTVEPEPPAITQMDIDNACVTAVNAARREWEGSHEQTRAATLAALKLSMADAREAAEQAALTVAEATVVTILSMLSGMLPHLCSAHGPDEVRALVTRLLPTIRSEPSITIRVHPELVKHLERDIEQLETELAGTVSVIAAPIERSDVKVSWQSGALSRDTRKVMQAMQDALGQLGLQLPLETSPKRRMAHAE